MYRVAIYIRVSTQDQSLDLQRSELKMFAKARGWKVLRIYEEKATGTSDKRPQLKEMMSAASAREFDCLLVWKMDRLFRSLKHLITSLQDFEALGILFVSLRENIDLSLPSGKLMMHMLGAFAEFERSMIVDRVNAGLREARRKGIQLGRPIYLDEQKALQLRKDGKSMAQIAKEMNCSKSAIFKILKRAS